MFTSLMRILMQSLVSRNYLVFLRFFFFLFFFFVTCLFDGVQFQYFQVVDIFFQRVLIVFWLGLRAILNKSWRQHSSKHLLYGHLPPITKTIQFRQTRHAGYNWRRRDELISDVLLWTLTYGRAKAGRPARTYIQKLCEDTGCSPEDLPEAMNDREKWGERIRDIRAGGTTWWWWWWILFLLLSLFYHFSLLASHIFLCQNPSLYPGFIFSLYIYIYIYMVLQFSISFLAERSISSMYICWFVFSSDSVNL